ncbi:hypothetical protein [Rhizobium rhizogenes]|uniref:hypothetical protein n=1 Tax=Rhizobium rhizogenes TaxID=359 RepID=UPI00226DC019|nr:hypothetical protein [Rhizobium rhizogenes]
MVKKPSKSETLTIRLDPKTRFMLDFVSRLRGQSITTVVERAISEAANGASIQSDDSYGAPSTWRDFWSVTEGERAIKIAREDLLHPTYEEERRLKFAEQFWQFFFTNSNKNNIRLGYIEVLWPRIDEFIKIYDTTKQTDYFAAGEAMQAALSAARLVGPDWPEGSKPKSGGNFSRDLDDDIPF